MYFAGRLLKSQYKIPELIYIILYSIRLIKYSSLFKTKGDDTSFIKRLITRLSNEAY